jgi:hypothetical protein
VGALAAGASVQLKVVVRPVSAGSITNSARIASAEADSFPANNNSSVVATVNAMPVAKAVARYRLYSPVTQEHHFTTDANEYKVLGSQVGMWVPEGTVGKMLDNPGSFNGVVTVPYYRLYNSTTRWHHWTTDSNEYYTLATYPGWSAEGVDGFVLPANTTGATQLYRLLYPDGRGLHHWTIDANEYRVLVSQYGWIGEGGTSYVIQ